MGKLYIDKLKLQKANLTTKSVLKFFPSEIIRVKINFTGKLMNIENFKVFGTTNTPSAPHEA